MVDAQFFVGIGAQKAGTTWLGRYLAEHSQVTMSPLKELHHFDARFRRDMSGYWDEKWREIQTELIERYLQEPDSTLLRKIRCVAMRLEMIDAPERYVQYFSALLDSATRAFGEITPAYSLLPPAGFEAIQSCYPDSRFVFIARDPAARFLSQVRFTCKQRDIKLTDSFDVNAAALSYLDNVHFQRRSDYLTILTNLYQVAPRERVLVLFFETLFNPTSTDAEVR